MNIQEIVDLNIKHYLPHRDPMLVVDVIIELSNEHVKTIYKIPNQGIFIDKNKFQEVGIIENMAQTCSAIVGQKYFQNTNDNSNLKINVIGFISAIKKIEIFDLPFINTELQTYASLISRFESTDYSICTMNVTTTSNKTKIAQGTINLFLQKV